MKSPRQQQFRRLPLFATIVVIASVFAIFLLLVALPRLDSAPAKGKQMLIVLGVLMFMLVWSFVRVSTTDPGPIPDWFNDAASPNARLQSKSVEKKRNGKQRRCKKCHLNKPDRTHHCSVCRRCNLKMDHHCPWVNNCVGYHNHKFFVLFISYSLAAAVFVFVNTLLKLPTLDVHEAGLTAFALLLVVIITGGLSLALTAFVSFHLYLLSRNYTTIEFLEKRGCWAPDGHVNAYDMGLWGNIARTMGYNPLLWPFPVRYQVIDQGEGTAFDVNPNANVDPL